MVKYGVSGSTVLSRSDQLDLLFWPGIQHVEIGSLASEEDLHRVVAMAHENGTTLGIHSPLYRGGSKYDLIESVQYSTAEAWRQLERELRVARDIGAAYVLVHFPFFSASPRQLPEQGLLERASRLRDLQELYGVPIVCEPKLAMDRTGGGVSVVGRLPAGWWGENGLRLCWDMGDYLIALGDGTECLAELRRLKGATTVVHLHNVHFGESKYYWVPVHPSHEASSDRFSVARLLAALRDTDLLLVWEHTPEFTPSQDFALEGYCWVRELMAGRDDKNGLR